MIISKNQRLAVGLVVISQDLDQMEMFKYLTITDHEELYQK